MGWGSTGCGWVWGWGGWYWVWWLGGVSGQNFVGGSSARVGVLRGGAGCDEVSIAGEGGIARGGFRQAVDKLIARDARVRADVGEGDGVFLALPSLRTLLFGSSQSCNAPHSAPTYPIKGGFGDGGCTARASSQSGRAAQ